MIVYYSAAPIEELSISAGAEEYASLAEGLLRGRAQMDCEADGVDPAPYQTLLRRVLISDAPGELVVVRVAEGGDLLIYGGEENLSQMAGEVEAFGEDEGLGDHLHIEYHPDHFYLSPDAVPLVITRSLPK